MPMWASLGCMVTIARPTSIARLSLWLAYLVCYLACPPVYFLCSDAADLKIYSLSQGNRGLRRWIWLSFRQKMSFQYVYGETA